MATNRLNRFICVMACAAGAVAGMACNTSPIAPLPPTPPPTAIVTSGPWVLTGVAIGDDGRTIKNAPLWVNNGSPGYPGTTDANGRYHVTFDAKYNSYSYKSTAMVYLNAGADYEHEHRLFRPTSLDRNQTLDLHPRLIRYITVGDTVSVTVTPDDKPCYNNVQDGSWSVASLCRTVRLVVPSDGVVTVEAVTVDAQALRLPIEVDIDPEPWECCYLGNPLTIPVKAGMLLKISVEIVEGTPGRTFKLTTTIR